MTVAALDLNMRDYRLELWLFVVMLVVVLLPGADDLLAFDRSAIDQGQVWRLLTGHVAHLSITHALGNVGGLALLAFMVRRAMPEQQLLGLFLWCALVVGCGLYVIAPDLNRYVGLSGVLHGVLLAVPFVLSLYRGWPAWFFLALIVSKVLWEQTPFYNDQALMEVIGGRVETRAHILGMCAGGIWLVAMAMLGKLSRH